MPSPTPACVTDWPLREPRGIAAIEIEPSQGGDQRVDREQGCVARRQGPLVQRFECQGVCEREIAARRSRRARSNARRSRARRRCPRQAHGCRCPCCSARAARVRSPARRASASAADLDGARMAHDLHALARVLVVFAPITLERRVARRHLRDAGPRNARSTASTSPRDEVTGACVARLRLRRRRSWSSRRGAAARRRSCPRRASACANLVASPKQIGSNPVASGSRVPVWPALSAWYRRFARCSAALDDRPFGLSSSSTPSMRRRGRRG